MLSFDLGKGLVKFKHCGKEIFSYSLPQNCPICGQPAVSSSNLKDAPVTIPSPFVNGHKASCSFLVKPTEGTFLRDYDGNSDLHVGVTNTTGTVYHYNQTGIHRDDVGWEQCVCIPLIQPSTYGLINQWDRYLDERCASEAWLPCRYEEHCHNCYTFALAFVNYILAAQGRNQLSKSEFTERFVLPRTRRASKYISICKEVAANNFYVLDCSDLEEMKSQEANLVY
ncbi:MKRN2 opposite strand protein [Microcaecilia unicolor]|uniref:MKRN2 opposite strand protein n=1 Tax=Microcaecilia unicolor TaxID=1415580 RepID=A0A6P7YEL8_9AMPH|nr:MKRN2 opposite strand protein [Microcaecilia unicolor]